MQPCSACGTNNCAFMRFRRATRPNHWILDMILPGQGTCAISKCAITRCTPNASAPSPNPVAINPKHVPARVSHLRRRRARLHALRARRERSARGGQVARAQVLQALPHRLQQVRHRAPARFKRTLGYSKAIEDVSDARCSCRPHRTAQGATYALPSAEEDTQVAAAGPCA